MFTCLTCHPHTHRHLVCYPDPGHATPIHSGHPNTHIHTNAHVMDALYSIAAAAFAGGDDGDDDEIIEDDDDAAAFALLTDAGAIVGEDQLHGDRVPLPGNDDDDDDGGEQDGDGNDGEQGRHDGGDAVPDQDLHGAAGDGGGTATKRAGKEKKNVAPAELMRDIKQGGKTLWYCPFDLETTGGNRYTSATCQFGAVSCISGGTCYSADRMPSTSEAAAGMEYSATYSPRNAKWDEACTAVHGMSKASNAGFPDDEGEEAWKLYAWMVKQLDAVATKLDIDPAHVLGVFIVHNGASCDLDWLFHIGRKFDVWPPDRMKYYWDTYTAVRTPPPPRARPCTFIARHCVIFFCNCTHTTLGRPPCFVHSSPPPFAGAGAVE